MKSKYDDLIYYDKKHNLIVHVKWDCTENGVDVWFIQTGQGVRWAKGYLYECIPERYVYVDRFPEGTL